MKYLILFLLLPFSLFSQKTIFNPGQSPIVYAGDSSHNSINNLKTIHEWANQDSSSITIEYDDTSGWDTTITLPRSILKEGWYIQHADRIGTYNVNGKIIWGTSEPVYQGPSLYPDGWVDSIPKVVWNNGSATAEPITITDKDTGSLSVGDGGSYVTNTGIVTVYSDWMVETGWKMLNKGRIDNCPNHDWLNASEQAGNYNTTTFQIGLAKGDMLQECRICVKCKRMETQLTFMGNGTNPFIWEVTQSIYQQLLEKKK